MSASTPTKIRTRRERLNKGYFPEIPVRDTEAQELDQDTVLHNSTVKADDRRVLGNTTQNSCGNETIGTRFSAVGNKSPGFHNTFKPIGNGTAEIQHKTSTHVVPVSTEKTKKDEFSHFLYGLWQNQRMCDIIIKVNGAEYKAHKVALAAHSDSFMATYCNRLPTSVSEVNLANSSSDAVESILQYIYTRELNLNDMTIDGVTACAKQLGITTVLDMCKSYLLKNDVQKIFTMWIIADKHGLTDVLMRLDAKLCENFAQVYRSTSFLNGYFEQILYFISKDDLNVGNELDVFRAAATWIDFNRQERLQHAQELMKYVRFVHISPEDLAQYVEPLSHIFQTKDCSEMLFKAYRHHSLSLSGSKLSGSMKIPKRQSVTQTSVLIDPEIKEIPSIRTRAYSTESARITNGDKPRIVSTESAMSRSRAYSTGSLGTKIKEASQRATECSRLESSSFDPETAPIIFSPGKYRPSQSEVTFKYDGYSTNTLLNDGFALPPRPATFLAVGGIDPFNADSEVTCRQVEVFNPKANCWNHLTSLPEPRHHLGVAMLDGYLYVIGGSVLIRNDPENLANPTDICFRYDPQNNYWARIASLRQPRMYLSVCVLEGVLYALGGNDSYGRSLDTVEYYNPDDDSWGLTAPMSEAKIGMASVGFKGMLYVTGGFQEQGDKKVVLETVECYDPRSNNWIIRNPLPIPCCHANLVEAKGELFLIGGSTIMQGNETINSLAFVFRLFEPDDRWDLVQNLHTSRHDSGAAAIDSRIYVVGGVSSEEGRALIETECLDIDLLTWIEGMESLRYPALGIACCTFDGDED